MLPPSIFSVVFAAATSRASCIVHSARAEKSFEDFVREHNRPYKPGSIEYFERRVIFERHATAVNDQNSRADSTWTAGFSMLADRTEEELAGLRGYIHGVSPKSSGGNERASLLSTSEMTVDAAELPASFTWKGALKALDEPMDQGFCGSCWAVAAAKVLAAHSEILSKPRTFSVQQLVTCTPNPRHCGGNGGCDGATAALALQYAAEAGVIPEEAWSYDAGQGSGTVKNSCPPQLTVQNVSAKKLQRGKGFGLYGFQQNAENKLSAVMEAIYTTGPLSVAVAATKPWNLYARGVLESCGPSAIVNHAVVLMGYGTDGDKGGWWHIMNSWGSSWGEKGFLRLQRHEGEQEESWCGWDSKPKDGSGCDGGPSKVWVCGSCGILYDTNMPVFKAQRGSAYAKARGDMKKLVATMLEEREKVFLQTPMLQKRNM